MKHSMMFFGIPVTPLKKQEVLGEVKDFLSKKSETFYHVTSLNPEIIVMSSADKAFKTVLAESSLKITDGTGVSVAMKLLKLNGGERYAGVDLMEDIIGEAAKERLQTVLIGGKENLANELADCYNRKFGVNIFFAINVSQNISGMTRAQNEALISSISALKPRILFVAFGSPVQEKWIYENRASLSGVLCMGVGGAFDFAGGEVRRAPKMVRAAGMEWLFRLILQPWRLKRQLRLVTFVTMVIKERMRLYARK